MGCKSCAAATRRRKALEKMRGSAQTEKVGLTPPPPAKVFNSNKDAVPIKKGPKNSTFYVSSD